MGRIAHEFTDLLSDFLGGSTSLNEKDWLKQLNDNQLTQLIDILQFAIEGKGFPSADEHEAINKNIDAHLLIFKINNIGKKRHISKIEPNRRLKLMKGLLSQAQLALISRGLI